MQRSKQAKKAVHNSMDDIRDHAGGMAGSIGDIGTAVKDVFIEKLTDVLRRAVSLGDRGQEAVRDAAEDVRENIEERIQARPYKAVLIAAGIGLVLGLLVRRR